MKTLNTGILMTRLRSYSAVAFGVAIIFFSMQATVFAEDHSIFDLNVPGLIDIVTSLQIVKKITKTKKLTASEILQIYKAEKKISRCVWSETPDAITEQQIHMSVCSMADVKVLAECFLYVQTNSSRFKMVPDNFRGDENFWEPNRYWLERINKIVPHSQESKEIEFDLDFNEFIRHFDINEEEKGKSCKQHVNEELKADRDMFEDVYTEDDFKQWIPECEQARKNFEIGRRKLLKKFQNAPFTKKLKDIDKTTIVVFHHVC
jgi:hypothetical protein